MPACPQGQCVHQKDSGSLLLHLSASPQHFPSLPCSSLSPVDSHLPNGVGGGMGRGSLAVGGKLQASLFGPQLQWPLLHPGRELVPGGRQPGIFPRPPVCREQLSSQGHGPARALVSLCRCPGLCLLPELVLPGCSPTSRMLPCSSDPLGPRPLKGPKATAAALCARQGLLSRPSLWRSPRPTPRLWVG